MKTDRNYPYNLCIPMDNISIDTTVLIRTFINSKIFVVKLKEMKEATLIYFKFTLFYTLE